MKEVASDLLDKLDIPSGAFVDIRLQNSLSLMMQVRKGLTTEVGSTRMGGAGVRALIGGAWGFASIAFYIFHHESKCQGQGLSSRLNVSMSESIACRTTGLGGWPNSVWAG